MDDERIVLRSYSNLKNIKAKLYKIGDIPILVPIAIESAIIFAISVGAIFIINKIIQIPLNPIYTFIAIPLGITMLFKTTKIDGKNPHIYLLRLLQYQRIRKKTIERFEIIDEIEEIKFYK